MEQSDQGLYCLCLHFCPNNFDSNGDQAALLVGGLVIFSPFKQFSVISGCWADENERLCAMEPHLGLERSPPHAGLELKTTRSVDQGLIK